MKKQMGFRIDKEEAKKLQIMLTLEELSFQDYIVSLIKKDMIEKGNK